MKSWLPVVYLVLLSQNLTYGKQGMPGLVVWTVLSCLMVGLLFSARWREGVGRGCERLFEVRWFWAALAVGCAVMQWLAYRRFGLMGYRAPWFSVGVCVIGAFGAFVLKGRARAAVACAMSVLVLVGDIGSFSLDPHRSDMLPVISEAWAQWARGGSPYGALSLPGYGPDGMPYLPGLFLSYAPAWWAGVDPRWTSVVARAVWMGLVFWRFRSEERGARWDALAVFALNPALSFRHDLYFEFFVLVVTLYWLAPGLRWLWIPVGFVTRQWFWVVTPFLVLARPVGMSWVAWLSRLAFGFAVVVGGCWWFLRESTSIEQFRAMVFTFQGWIDHPVYLEDLGFTFAPVFFRLGWAHAMQPVQGAFCFGVWAWAVVRRRDLAWAATLCWVGFVMLNPHFWGYFWVSWAVWVVVGSLMRAPPPLEERGRMIHYSATRTIET